MPRVALLGVAVMLSAVGVLAAEGDPSNHDASSPFVSNGSSLSAAQSAEYAEAQSSVESDPAYSATGADDGGVSGLEVLGIILLLGLAGAAIAVAASSGG